MHNPRSFLLASWQAKPLHQVLNSSHTLWRGQVSRCGKVQRRPPLVIIKLAPRRNHQTTTRQPARISHTRHQTKMQPTLALRSDSVLVAILLAQVVHLLLARRVRRSNVAWRLHRQVVPEVQLIPVQSLGLLLTSPSLLALLRLPKTSPLIPITPIEESSEQLLPRTSLSHHLRLSIPCFSITVAYATSSRCLTKAPDDFNLRILGWCYLSPNQLWPCSSLIFPCSRFARMPNSFSFAIPSTITLYLVILICCYSCVHHTQPMPSSLPFSGFISICFSYHCSRHACITALCIPSLPMNIFHQV